MQLIKSLAVLALSSGALAQLQITDSIAVSVLQVLATAIPPSVISKATADPLAFSSELDSSLRNGQTPSWYQALPSDVKSYLPQLYPAETPASTTGASATAGPSSSAVTGDSSAASSPAPTSTGTGSAASTGASSTDSASPSSSGDANSDAAPTSTSTGGASYPTGMVGAGVAGAIGILGMLAL